MTIIEYLNNFTKFQNCQRAVSAGVAERLNFNDLSVERIRTTVLKVLQTPSYKENMMRRSQIFRDQETKPLDRALWWIEYALRHPNVATMKSPTIELGTIRANLWDVYALYVAIVFAAYKLVTGVLGSMGRKRVKQMKRD